MGEALERKRQSEEAGISVAYLLSDEFLAMAAWGYLEVNFNFLGYFYFLKKQLKFCNSC